MRFIHDMTKLENSLRNKSFNHCSMCLTVLFVSEPVRRVCLCSLLLDSLEFLLSHLRGRFRDEKSPLPPQNGKEKVQWCNTRKRTLSWSDDGLPRRFRLPRGTKWPECAHNFNYRCNVASYLFSTVINRFTKLFYKHQLSTHLVHRM